MASGIFALFDDVAVLMDDVAVLSKIATKKTAGILGDDLAVNAEKAMGFVSSREIPVLLAITKGSFINKLIILPVAFFLSWLYPPAIIAILLFGGLYLAYEGAHKIASVFVPHKKETAIKSLEDKKPSPAEVLANEKAKIKSAITTDFILSIEIVIIAMGTVPTSANFLQKIIVVSIVALIATVGVYGIVAILVRMDDFGYKLIKIGKGDDSVLDYIGIFLVKALPWIIKLLTVVGTIALVLVAGGIFTHNLEYFHHLLESLPSMAKDFIIGLIVGFIVFAVVKLATLIIKKIKK
ncbi:MAG: DUF808 domain-containing protein [Chitinophagales bacterium]